jgi:hypothetical protein
MGLISANTGGCWTSNSVWVVAVLYWPVSKNITTQEALKNLLTANNTGGTVPVSGVLNKLS